MKLRYIITALTAAVALLAGCQEETLILDEVQLSKSLVAIPVAGGEVSVDITAVADWQIKDIPEWLTVSPVSGKAGNGVIKFSAEAIEDARTASLNLVCGDVTQIINVMQGIQSTEIVPCKTVIDGPDGKTFRIKGAVSKIEANIYGNYWVTDEAGDQVYIYGTLDKNGAEKNFASWGLENGDIITVQGPKTTYNTKIELVNVTVIEIQKSLIKLVGTDPEDATLEKEGGKFSVTLENKGSSIEVVVPEEAKSWISIEGISFGKETVVTFNVAENTEGERSIELTFVTKADDKSYSVPAVLTQKGSIIPATADDLLKAAVGGTVYRIKACVTDVADAAKGNFTISDHTGSIYVYKCSGATDIKVGDIIQLTGKRGEYKGTAQITNGASEEITKVSTVSVVDFLAKAESKTDYYMLTGKICKPTAEESANNCKFDLAKYGNFMLEDETGRVYVYGVYKGWGGKSGEFASIGAKEGDTITIVGVRASYKGLNQLGSGFYISHKSN